MTRSIRVREFKAMCLAVLDRGRETRERLVLAKRGMTVGRVEPADSPPSLLGTARQLVSDDELVEPLYEDMGTRWTG